MSKTLSKKKEAVAMQEVTISLPFGTVEQQGYEAQQAAGGKVSLSRMHLNVQLGQKGARALIRVRNGLRAANARLPDGRPVWTSVDALRYVLEVLSDAAA